MCVCVCMSELQFLGGLEKVEVMVMRRRLRWLGNVERMDIPQVSAGEQATQREEVSQWIGGTMFWSMI